MKVQTILDRAKSHFNKDQPFVMYCKPGSTVVTGIFQKDNRLYTTNNWDETGFVFSSFDGKTALLIPENESETMMADFGLSGNKLPDAIAEKNPTAQIAFENLVRKGISAISAGRFGKVVLSRKEKVVVPGMDFTVVFERLLDAYPNAFGYCWFHPETGIWIGATPEQLLRAKGPKFETVALAGTQQFIDTEHVFWQEKEKAEQQFVTDFITESLQDKVSHISLSAPYTARAGNLLHLKTDIEGTFETQSGLKEVIDILHPTPAVCGFPKAAAKKFIFENEGYEREFYSGFLGELNKDFTSGESGSDFFVNLRCMKIEDDVANIYIGCGITKDSIPEMEYIETVNKSLTMKKVLL